MLNTVQAQEQLLDQGIDILQLVGQGGNVLYTISNKGGTQSVAQLISANGAINPRVPGLFIITKGSAAALTLAAPIAGTDDGLEIQISASTAFAHTVTATGLLQTGTAVVNVATFPTLGAGGTLYLTAYNAKWIAVAGGSGVTFT